MNIRPYQSGDAGLIAAFLERCFRQNTGYEVRSHSPAYYQWKYAENPWGKPIVRVAENEGLIVGLMAMIPKPFWIDGKTVTAGETGDTFMDPAARGGNTFLDIASQVLNASTQAGIRMIYGSPNSVSYPVMVQLLDYREIFRYRSFIRPLKPDLLIHQALVNRSLSVWVGRPLNWIHRSLYWPRPNSQPFSLEYQSEPSPVLDRLWDEIRFRIPCSLRKDREYMTWRFYDHPDEYRVYVVNRKNRPAGWLVVKLTPVKNMLFGHIVDLTLPHASEEVPALWHLLLTELENLQADFVHIWAAHHSADLQMKKYGFVMRKKPFWIVMRIEDENRPVVDFSRAAAWFFSQADTDNI